VSQEVIPYITDDDVFSLSTRCTPIGEKFSQGKPVSEDRFFVLPRDLSYPYRHWDVRRDIQFGSPFLAQDFEPFDVFETYHLDTRTDRRFHATAGECLAWLKHYVSFEKLELAKWAYMPLRDSAVDPYMSQFRLAETARPRIPMYLAGRILVWKKLAWLAFEGLPRPFSAGRPLSFFLTIFRLFDSIFWLLILIHS
jgi:hypothetical protein